MLAFRPIIASLIGCVSLLSLSACDSIHLGDFQGDYSGWRTALNPGAAAENSTVHARAELSNESNRETLVLRTDKDDAVSISLVSSNEIEVKFGQRDELRLNLDESACFKNGAASKICLGDEEIDIDLEWGTATRYSLTLRKNFELPQLETPKAYASSALIQQALARGFDTLQDYEKLKLAQATAKNAEMNLLPHISAFSATTFIQFQPLSLLRLAGELTPFLFPSRWFRKDVSAELAEAQAAAFRISQLDRAFAVENLIAQSLRDSQLSKLFDDRLSSLRLLRKDIAARENVGLLARGATDTIDGLIGAIEQSAIGTKQSARDSLSALSIAAGFYNPRAVETLQDDRSIPTDDLVAVLSNVSVSELRETTLLRALELKQLNSLVAAARSEKTARIWNWLDPSPEGNGTIGFALPSYLEIGDTKVSQVLLQRDQMKAILLQKVEGFSSGVTTALKGLEIARAQSEIQARRTRRLSQQLYLGLNVSLLELATALQDQMRADIARVSIEATLRAYEAQLRRLRSI